MKQYRFDKKIGEKNELVSLDKQPSPEDIIWVNRYYLSLVASNTYKKNFTPPSPLAVGNSKNDVMRWL